MIIIQHSSWAKIIPVYLGSLNCSSATNRIRGCLRHVWYWCHDIIYHIYETVFDLISQEPFFQSGRQAKVSSWADNCSHDWRLGPKKMIGDIHQFHQHVALWWLEIGPEKNWRYPQISSTCGILMRNLIWTLFEITISAGTGWCDRYHENWSFCFLVYK